MEEVLGIDGVSTIHFSKDEIRREKSIKSARSTVEPRDICRAAKAMADNRYAVLPVISYQSFSRVSNQKRNKWENPFSDDYSRVVGYVDCLEEAANDKMLSNWCKKMEQIAWQQGETILEYEIVKKTVHLIGKICIGAVRYAIRVIKEQSGILNIPF